MVKKESVLGLQNQADFQSGPLMRGIPTMLIRPLKPLDPHCRAMLEMRVRRLLPPLDPSDLCIVQARVRKSLSPLKPFDWGHSDTNREGFVILHTPHKLKNVTTGNKKSSGGKSILNFDLGV